MPMKCYVPTCRIQTDDKAARDVSFHRLPALDSSKEAWIKELQKYFDLTFKKYTYVCSQHFDYSCFVYSGLCQERKLKPGSVLTVFLTAEGIEVKKRCEGPSPIIESVNIFVQCDSVDEQDSNRAPLLENHDRLIPSVDEKIQLQKDKNIALRLRNKILMQRLARAKNRISDLTSVLGNVKRKKYISDAESTILQVSIV